MTSPIGGRVPAGYGEHRMRMKGKGQERDLGDAKGVAAFYRYHADFMGMTLLSRPFQTLPV